MNASSAGEADPIEHDAHELRGARIAPHLTVQGVIGEGAFAVVYSVRDSHRREIVAAKVARRVTPLGLGALLPFEAELCRLVNSMRVPRVHEIGRLPDGRPFYTMELFESPSLDEVLQNEPFAVEDSLEIACELLKAIEDVHRAGILHRDVKPSNVILANSRRGSVRVKLIDFGISESPLLMEPGGQTEMVLGTPEYMAPEQILKETLDCRCDLYAVGALLYDMITGRPPHVGDRPRDVARAVLEDCPLPVTVFAPDCPEEVDDFVLKALSKDPDDRFESATAMRQTLETLMTSIRFVRRRRRRGSRGAKEIIAAAHRDFAFRPTVRAGAAIERGTGAQTAPFPLTRAVAFRRRKQSRH
jgi:eukaryotic-like serine/threonine-protein kinase